MKLNERLSWYRRVLHEWYQQENTYFEEANCKVYCFDTHAGFKIETIKRKSYLVTSHPTLTLFFFSPGSKAWKVSVRVKNLCFCICFCKILLEKIWLLENLISSQLLDGNNRLFCFILITTNHCAHIARLSLWFEYTFSLIHLRDVFTILEYKRIN